MEGSTLKWYILYLVFYHWKYAEMLVHAVISSRLRNCNSLASKLNLGKLQKVQNAAARLIVSAMKSVSTYDI